MEEIFNMLSFYASITESSLQFPIQLYIEEVEVQEALSCNKIPTNRMKFKENRFSIEVTETFKCQQSHLWRILAGIGIPY